MSKDLNKVMLIGRLGQDPEQKFIQNGTAITKFSLATTNRWKDQTGSMQEKTEWHNITAWGKLAEICGQYLRKGSKVYLEGSLTTSTWEDENKKKHYKTDVKLDDLIMLDAKGSGDGEKSEYSAKPTTNQESVADDDLPF